jgi:D-threo-aldose 1-dehydrogenase
MYQDAPQSLLTRARQMEAICKRYGVPLGAVALQFSLRDPRITSTIVGISRPERLSETINLAQYPIPAELWGELDAI